MDCLSINRNSKCRKSKTMWNTRSKWYWTKYFVLLSWKSNTGFILTSWPTDSSDGPKNVWSALPRCFEGWIFTTNLTPECEDDSFTKCLRDRTERGAEKNKCDKKNEDIVTNTLNNLLPRQVLQKNSRAAEANAFNRWEFNLCWKSTGKSWRLWTLG